MSIRANLALLFIGLILTLQPLAAQSPEPAKVVPLFDAQTKLEPATIEETPTALITRVADRVRDRHAREGMFHSYDHYLPLYWENRTVAIEIIDRVAKGGDSVTYNMTSLVPLNKPNLRAFFEGKGTVAQYATNLISTQIDPLHYTVTLKYNPIERRPIKVGDRIEIEFSPFLKAPVKGRTNYYGTAILYIVGRPGVVPWEGRGPRNDSFPLPEIAWSGGGMTLHEHHSDEPKERFKQIATNLAPINAQPFMLGRRLHHTDFLTGAHSERGNPIYAEQAGKLGSRYTERSCIACHVNNGRALPPAIGQPLTKYLVRVGSDAKGTPHPKLGATLQMQSVKGSPEASVSISSWTTIDGKYGDGVQFTLRKPNYQFTGAEPKFFSIRIAPPLVGMGLLEALREADVTGFSAGKAHVVSDPETGKPRLGRFGWKAGQARLSHQIAGALNNDMGLVTSIYPNPDRGTDQPEIGPANKLADADLDLLVRYVSVLGVPPRRKFADPEVIKGEAIFASAKCVQCHMPTMKTSPYHPFAELRNQTIHAYTDLRLHDLGDGLADNMADGGAGAGEWRTTPLWGIGLTRGVSGGEAYLHDGRARNLAEAILWHGGAAQTSREMFRTMPAADRTALIQFLRSL